ncbi:E3 ubiquitin-protein ligase parkin-like [Sycon ciliatum]|uniref:E3 ubiquitin-protein ligase parkin-like n=1 Tax=Sycon ciliatum TaxID=27933 RepID=UPI0031F65E2E
MSGTGPDGEGQGQGQDPAAAEAERGPPIVYVRFNHAQLTVTLTNTSSVGDIKRLVAEAQGVEAADIRLIFAGRELQDTHTLADYEVETQSILHAIANHSGIHALLPPTPGAPSLTNVDLASPTRSENTAVDGGTATAADKPEKSPAKFYIYCKDPRCKGVAQGKLRVRCAACKDDAFFLSQGPSCWEDVKVKGRIRGLCGQHSCKAEEAEFYFKCSRHKGEDGGNCIVLDLLQYNTYNMPCIVCMESEHKVIVVFPCDNNHVMCLECFNTYGITKLNDRSYVDRPRGYSISCPAPGCDDSFIDEIHHFHLLGEEQYERYQKFAMEDFVLKNGGVSCPHPRCGNPIELEGNHSRRIQCPYCRHVFCKTCKGAFHQGQCDRRVRFQPTAEAIQRSEISISEEAAQNAAMSQQIIQDTTRPCPRCNIAIEKNGGCMHMKCRCNYEWCWLCRTEWGRECQNNHWFGRR